MIELDLNAIEPCVAGPKRPQDRIDLPDLKDQIPGIALGPDRVRGIWQKRGSTRPAICVHADGHYALPTPHLSGGNAELDEGSIPATWSEAEMVTNRPFTETMEEPEPIREEAREEGACDILLSHGSVVIAAITSCTNTSNPHVMLAAGLLAKKAVEKGLKVNSGSRPAWHPAPAS